MELASEDGEKSEPKMTWRRSARIGDGAGKENLTGERGHESSVQNTMEGRPNDFRKGEIVPR